MTNTAVTETAAEPDWAKYGLQAQQPSMAEAERAYDYEQETDSEENDLFKEQQVGLRPEKNLFHWADTQCFVPCLDCNICFMDGFHIFHWKDKLQFE